VHQWHRDLFDRRVESARTQETLPAALTGALLTPCGNQSVYSKVLSQGADLVGKASTIFLGRSSKPKVLRLALKKRIPATSTAPWALLEISNHLVDFRVFPAVMKTSFCPRLRAVSRFHASTRHASTREIGVHQYGNDRSVLRKPSRLQRVQWSEMAAREPLYSTYAREEWISNAEFGQNRS
jgi:hypothetical protein